MRILIPFIERIRILVTLVLASMEHVDIKLKRKKNISLSGLFTSQIYRQNLMPDPALKSTSEN